MSTTVETVPDRTRKDAGLATPGGSPLAWLHTLDIDLCGGVARVALMGAAVSEDVLLRYWLVKNFTVDESELIKLEAFCQAAPKGSSCWLRAAVLWEQIAPNEELCAEELIGDTAACLAFIEGVAPAPAA